MFFIYLLFNSPLAHAGTPPFNPCVDWTRVTQNGERYTWRDGCKGDLNAAQMMCTEMLINLKKSELKQYHAWVKAKKPAPPKKCYQTDEKKNLQ